MKLKDMSDIYSGYIARGRIEASAQGSHYLLQAKNVNADRLTYETDGLIRFNPAMSRNDQLLEKGDLLFMARGENNFTVQLEELPEPVLAAACFFIVRLSGAEILPGYLSWYMNQAPVGHYLIQNSGRGVHMPVVRRAVLENVEVPVPPMALQIQIADMNMLVLKEMNLLRQLCQKRGAMMTAACLQAIRDY